MKKTLLSFAFFLLVQGTLYAGFFNINSLRYMERKSGTQDIFDKNGNFIPHIRLEVFTNEAIFGSGLTAKVYFYDQNRELIGIALPHPATRDKDSRAMPLIFDRGKREFLYFPIPSDIVRVKWSAVAVFGDDHAVDAKAYPASNQYVIASFPFNEYDIFSDPREVSRLGSAPPQIVEHSVRTTVTIQPEINFVLCKPAELTDFSEAEGVVALCLLQSTPEMMRRRLMDIDMEKDLVEVIKFARENKYLILGWGTSNTYWNAAQNWNAVNDQERRQIDRTSNALAEAWGRGVDHLARTYNFDKNNLLLYGFSSSAQYAARLALRKPEYFLAAHIHIASSFDQPVRAANKVLWCLTTGENESGYLRSIEFFEAAKKEGYPIVYKAIPELEHKFHEQSNLLGMEFFKYALSLKKEKAEFNKKFAAVNLTERTILDEQPWPESFRRPEYVGDIFFQRIYANEDILGGAEGKVALPTQKIAGIWYKLKTPDPVKTTVLPSDKELSE